MRRISIIWDDFSKNMNNIIVNIKPESVELQEPGQTWQKISQALQVTITDFLKNHDNDLVKLQEN